jgi:hypothetical protein
VLADVLTRYYALNFIRKPEFMGFNGYNDGIKRTAFNPLAWGDTVVGESLPFRSNDVWLHNTVNASRQIRTTFRATPQWSRLVDDEQKIGETLPPQFASAFFELVGYPVEGSAAMNEKFLATDLTYLDAHNHNDAAALPPTPPAPARGTTQIQTLTAKYNSLEAASGTA